MEKNRSLMDILLHGREEIGYTEFLKALRKEPVYKDLSDQIENTEVTDRDRSILQSCQKLKGKD